MSRLDLRKDFAEILAYVADRVRSFDPKANDGPGKSKTVRRIDVGYQCDQAGWVALIFDTRPKAEPDGRWTLHIREGNTLDRPGWLAAFESLEDGPMVVVLPDGAERKLRKGGFEKLTTILGDLLKGVLLKAKADGIIDGLPKARRCELAVEEQSGGYGWPIYEERGRENLA